MSRAPAPIEMRECPICGKGFAIKRTLTRQTCSSDCNHDLISAKLRQSLQRRKAFVRESDDVLVFAGKMRV